MKYKIFLLIFTALIAVNKSTNAAESHCSNLASKDPSQGDFDWLISTFTHHPINDIDTFTTVFTYEGKLGYDNSKEGSGALYIDVVNDDKAKTLTFATNNEFKNFDLKTAKQNNEAFTLTVTITLTCNDDTTTALRFMVDVKDTNNNSPTFKKPSYEYTVPMPLVPHIDLTGFGESIVATDIDFSNTDVTFTLDPQDKFVLSTVANGKDYHAVLKVTEFFRLTQDTTYVITAQDNKEPYLTSKANILFKVDKDNTLPDIPKFHEPLYKYQYSVVDNKPVISGTTGTKITVTTTDPQKTTIKIQDNEYCEANYDPSTNEVTIKSTGTLIETTEHVLIYTLTVTLDSNPNESSQTIILIDIPDNNVITVPSFSKPYYTATYSTDTNPHTVSLDDGQTIKVTNDAESVTVTLDGDYASNFKISKFNEQWQLSLLENLNEDVLKKGGKIVLTLDAAVTDSPNINHGFATLIINLPEIIPLEVPEFSQTFYKGTYTVNASGSDTVTITDGPISLINLKNDETVDVTFDPSSDNFRLQKVTDHWEVVVVKKLDDGIIAAGNEIVLKVKATVTGDGAESVDPGTCTLIISLPEKDIAEIPVFSQPHYKVTYQLNEDGSGKVDVIDGPIQITNAEDKAVDVTFVEHTDNFQIAPDADNTFIFSITNPLSIDQLKDGNDIVLTLKASLTVNDSPLTGFATIIVKLPDIVIPQFSQPIYTGTYIASKTAKSNITLNNGPIEISLPTKNNVDVTLSPSSEYFSIDKDKDNNNQWVISVLKNVANEILESGHEYTFTLQATVIEKDTVNNVGVSSLVIEVPKVDAPKFLKPQYSGKYIDGDSPTVEIEQIEVDSSDIIPTTFALDGNYVDHFQFEYDTTPQFTVKTKLGNDIIDAYQEIVMTLQVSYEGSAFKESTVIVLNLPYVETPPTLKFEKPSYTFSYIVDGENHSIDNNGENIKLVNGDDNVAISISGSNQDNFEMKRNTDGTYSLAIIKPLDKDVLDSDADELLIATASSKGFLSGSTAILLNLPKKVLPAAPQFTKSVFVANYIKADDGSSDTVEMVDKIVVSSKSGDKMTVKIQPTSDFFEIIPDTTQDTYKVHLKSNLDETTLIQQVDVVLKLQATIETSPNVGESALVIKLPKKVSPATFSNKYYTAEYIRNKDGKDTVKLADDITLNGDYVTETMVTLDAGDYKNYFSVSTTVPYTITVTKNLEDAILDGQSEIIVTLIGSLDESSLTTSAPIIIALPTKPNPPQFSRSLYSASYDPDTIKVTLTEDISVSPDDAIVDIADSQYKENLKLSLNTSKKIYTVEVIKPFNNETVNNEKEIQVVLVASVDRAVTNDMATLVIKMPEKTVNIVPKFSELYYVAIYQNKTGLDELQMSDSITITSDHSSDTTVTVATYTDNFKAERVDERSWKLTVISDLNDTILNQAQIILKLEANLPGSLQPGGATVIVDLPSQNKYAAPEFTETYYYAKYYYDDKNNPAISMAKSIAVVESIHSKLVEVTLSGENHEHFSLDLDTSQNLWNLNIVDPFKPEFLKVNTELKLILTATLENSVSDGTATLLIGLLPDKSPVSFDKPWYYVNYEVNDKGIDTITSDDITISDSKADVTLEGDYSSNFDIDCSSSICKLSVNQDLSNETLTKETETVLILKAQKADVETITEVIIIVSLPKKALRAAPEFTSTYYTAVYNVNQGDHSVKITGDNIEIKDDSTKQVKVTIADDNYTQYFSLKPVEDHWELELSSKLSDDILNENIQLVLKLVGTLESSSGDGSATLLIALPGWGKSAIHFSSPYYEAEYSVKEGLDIVDLKGDSIKVKMDGAVINTIGPYAENFKVECDSECHLMVKNDLSQDVLNTESEILLLLEATKEYINDKGQATVIINLPEPLNKPEFSQSVYTAEYTGESVSVVDNQIAIKNANITNTDVELDGEHKECFDLVKQEDHWELKLEQPLPSDVVKDQSAILLSLVGHVGSLTLKAALVIKLPKTAVNASIGFSDNVYMASYDGTNLTIEEEITVNGTSASEANIILSGDYEEYFKFSYTDNKVSITIDKPLPDDVLKKEVAISVDISATRGTEYVISSLVVKLPKQTDNSGGNNEDDGNDDKSGLIAAVAVLAVLLVGALVGSAVFYYIKFKRNGSNYNSMDDNLGPSEHFKRNSNPGTKNKFEHPTRRPTGVIKYPLSDESPGESVTEDDEIPEKRKSVQFDVVNIDELQIESEKPDENLDFETSENNIHDQNQEEDNTSYL